MIKMNVSNVSVDKTSNMPFVTLQSEDGKTSIPIWIGLFEASAIATQIENIYLPRPMTHDLFRNTLQELGGTLIQVEITDLKEGTYFAELVLEKESSENTIRVDARPSDAIALALRFAAPILVSEAVVEKAKTREKPLSTDMKSPEDQKKWKEILENLDPEAFGKYKQ